MRNGMCKMKGGEKMKVLKEQNPQQMVKIEGRLDSYREHYMPYGCSACEDGECGFCETNGD